MIGPSEERGRAFETRIILPGDLSVCKISSCTPYTTFLMNPLFMFGAYDDGAPYGLCYLFLCKIVTFTLDARIRFIEPFLK